MTCSEDQYLKCQRVFFEMNQQLGMLQEKLELALGQGDLLLLRGDLRTCVHEIRNLQTITAELTRRMGPPTDEF